MVASPALIGSAQKLQQSALCELLEAYWAVVHRVAWALCGQPAAAQQVVERVMARALHALPKWRDETAADRWFYHYTVLEARRWADDSKPSIALAAGDTLAPVEQALAAEYVAFVRAVRALPMQQREAIILNHGEHLIHRCLAFAMDCSDEAAANHLRVATLQLQAMAGERTAALLEELGRAYRALGPSEQALRPQIRSRV